MSAVVPESDATAPSERRPPWWVPHAEFLVVSLVIVVTVVATSSPIPVIPLSFVALAVLGWEGPWPWWTRDKPPP